METYHSEPNTAFDPRRQRVIGQQTTAQEELHHQVAESVNAGYLYDGKVVSPEKVIVYEYQAPCEAQQKADDPEKIDTQTETMQSEAAQAPAQQAENMTTEEQENG